MSGINLGAVDGANGFDAELNSELLAAAGQPSPETITSASLEAASTHSCPPFSITEIVKRLRALTLTLLPLEVDPDSLNEPTSRIITPQVVTAYHAAGGDFEVAVSMFRPCSCLLGSLCNDSYLIVCCAPGPNSCGMQTIIPRIMERTMVEVCRCTFRDFL